MKRHNLYVFRCDKKLSQAKMAEKCGVSRVTYGLIENGKRGGSADFWNAVQEVFCLSDEKTRQLQKLEEGTEAE